MTSIFAKPKRAIDRVFVHCSASDNFKHDSAAVIRQWHLANGWSDIGYHYFIRKNGRIEIGRSIEQTPAAQTGHNAGTIAICLHGLAEAKFTEPQLTSLKALCLDINSAYKGSVTFHGHREVAAKSCPVIDYKAILELDSIGRLGLSPGEVASLKPVRIGGLHRHLSAIEVAEAKPSTARYTLREGVKGADVEALQRDLTALGYHVGTIDGHFGKRTRAAVLAFQADNHLIADGSISDLTREVMEKALPREVSQERADKTVFSLASDGSRIARASIATGVTGTALTAGGALQMFVQLSDTVGTISDATSPFAGAFASLGPWLGVAVVVAGGFVVWQAIVAARARTDDHRTGKTA